MFFRPFTSEFADKWLDKKIDGLKTKLFLALPVFVKAYKKRTPSKIVNIVFKNKINKRTRSSFSLKV